MKVRMRGQISGTHDGRPWPARGDVTELPDDLALTLCRQGMAEAVRDAEPETATAPDEEVEHTTASEPRRRPGRPRTRF